MIASRPIFSRPCWDEFGNGVHIHLGTAGVRMAGDAAPKSDTTPLRLFIRSEADGSAVLPPNPSWKCFSTRAQRTWRDLRITFSRTVLRPTSTVLLILFLWTAYNPSPFDHLTVRKETSWALSKVFHALHRFLWFDNRQTYAAELLSLCIQELAATR